jgi:hypothetical protein
MSRTARGAIGLALLAVLVFPRAASADWWDFIWEMSGPQMIGTAVFQCKVDVLGQGATACRAIHMKAAGSISPLTERRLWLTLPILAHVGTGKDSDARPYDAWKNGMLSFDPMLEVRSAEAGGVDVYHSAGLTMNRLFGKGYTPLWNAGLKVRPIGVVFNGRWDAALNLRWYPDGFTAGDFGVGPVLPDAPGETTWGFSVARSW